MTRLPRRNCSIFLVPALAGIWALAALPASAQQPRPVSTGPVGFNNVVNYGYDNFAYSPNIRKFVDSLPGLGLNGCSKSIPAGIAGSCNQNNLGQYIPVADNRQNNLYPDADYYHLGVREYSLKMHSDLPPTRLRGYFQVLGSGQGQSVDPNIGGVNQYLGPLILAKTFDPSKPYKYLGNGSAVRILFQNNLPTGAAGKLFLPVDPTLMGAGMGPVTGQNYTDNRANLHLHGGNTPWISDGTPHQWITPAGETTIPAGANYDPYRKGASFQNVPDMLSGGLYKGTSTVVSPGDGTGTYYWTNQQSQRLMFFHDHSYGTTRLNVYGGMAAGYLLTDQSEDTMIANGVIPNQSGLGPVYNYGIPLVIQDRTFVNDAATPAPANVTTPTAQTLLTDPLWKNYAGTTGGNLWFPHEYMPNENIFDQSGALPWGRWDYGPWLNPATAAINTTLPSPSHVPETFADTMIVNGTAFPYVNVQPQAYRFRLLNAGNDRALNLQLYVAASKNYPTTPGTTGAVLCDGTVALPATDCTEVKMVPATSHPATPFCSTDLSPTSPTGRPANCTPSTWPMDGRNGGVPDPLTAGPQIIQIGNEAGILPQVVTLPAQPIDFEYSRRVPVILNVKTQSLLLMPAERADIIVDFSAFAGKTLILYSDAPAPMPLYDERNDLYTGSPDWTAVGGAPTTQAGYGPNTRTVMQINVCKPGTAGCLSAPAASFGLTALQSALPQAYQVTQAPPIVKQKAYNPAFGTANADTYVQNVDATVNLTGIGQGVSNARVTLPGSGFRVPPTVTFFPIDGNGSGAVATACLNGVSAITVTTAGAGYTTAPAVTFANPAGVTGTGVAAVASLVGGGVSTITVTNPGCNYTGNPNITIAAPACTINTTTCVAAAASANVTLGGVGSITMTCNPGVTPCQSGSGYTKAPLVFLKPVAGDPGSGATADAMLNGDTVIGMKNITEGFEPWYGRMNVQLGTTAVPLDTVTPAPQVPGIAMYIDPPSDYMNDGQTQVFRIAHLGVDSHIVHFHLVNMQVVNRVDFTNTLFPPLPNELGWKESIRTNPFTDLIVATKPMSQWLPFKIPSSNRLMDVTMPAGSTMNYIQPAPVAGLPNPTGISNVMTNYGWEYVWHCHLLGHEENDMMRPIVFNVPIPPVPTGLILAANGTQVNLAWNGGANTNAKIYTIQRSTSSTFPNTAATVTFTLNGVPPAQQYTDTPPGPGVYYYHVRSENGAGASAYGATVSINSTPPAAPTNLAAAIVAGPPTPQIGVTWTDASNNETSFTVFRSDLVNTTPVLRGTILRTAADSTATGATVAFYDSDPTLALNGTYTYTVNAVNSIGSTPATVSLSFAPPVAPSLLTAAVASASQINLTWRDNSGNESGFEVWRTDTTTNTPALVATVIRTGTQIASTGTNVTYTDTPLAPPAGANLVYYVRAVNLLGPSTPSPTITVAAPVAPGTPTAVVASATQVTLTWKDNSTNESSFQVYRSDAVNTTPAVVGTVTQTAAQITATGGNVTFTDAPPTVAANYPYAYYIVAVNLVGSSPNSGTASVAVPAAPTALSASVASATTVAVSWTDSSNNETGFEVLRTDAANTTPTVIATVNRTGTQITGTGGAAVTYTDTPPADPTNTPYTYSVRSVNFGGRSANVGPVTLGVPAAPSNLTIALTSATQVTLSWRDNSTNESGFEVWRSDAVNTTATLVTTVVRTGTQITGTAGTVTYIDTPPAIAANYPYVYYVRAVNLIGPSPKSGNASLAVPAIPTALAAAVASATQVSLTWTDSSTNETGFEVWRADTVSNTFAPVATVGRTGTQITGTGGTAVTYTDTPGTPPVGANWAYYVRAVNFGGPSANSGTVTVTAPVAASNLTAAIATATQITLSWRDNSNNETSFEVWRSDDLNATPAQVGTSIARTGTLITGTGTTVTFTDTTPAAGRTYTYYIVARNMIGSTQSATATIAFLAPTAPSNIKLTVANQNGNFATVTMTWTDTSTNETGFRIQYANNSAFTGATTATVGANVITYQTGKLSRGTAAAPITYYFQVQSYDAVGNSVYVVSSVPVP